MADEKDEDRCVPCDIIWNLGMAIGVACIAFIAWDVFSGGDATRFAARLFGKVSPKLAAVVNITEESPGDADAS
jgi:hypothetical protein